MSSAAGRRAAMPNDLERRIRRLERSNRRMAAAAIAVAATLLIGWTVSVLWP